MRYSGLAAEDVQDGPWNERDVSGASWPGLATPIFSLGTRKSGSPGQVRRRHLGCHSKRPKRSLFSALHNKSLNFRAGAVQIEIVMPAVGKAHETLGLVGEREQALPQSNRD